MPSPATGPAAATNSNSGPPAAPTPFVGENASEVLGVGVMSGVVSPMQANWLCVLARQPFSTRTGR
jgi:hypothetical protein